MSEQKKHDGINEGTKIKASLQLRAIDFMKEYEQKQTLESYAQLLCWDIHTTYRTALDSYIMPMMRHKYFMYEGDDKYTFIGNGKSNKKVKKGKIQEESLKEYNEEESLKEYAERRNKEKEENKK
jgi:hypothetical protein